MNDAKSSYTTDGPMVLNSLIHMDMSEVIRMIVSNGMILYALTRKTEGSK